MIEQAKSHVEEGAKLPRGMLGAQAIKTPLANPRAAPRISQP